LSKFKRVRPARASLTQTVKTWDKGGEHYGGVGFFNHIPGSSRPLFSREEFNSSREEFNSSREEFQISREEFQISREELNSSREKFQISREKFQSSREKYQDIGCDLNHIQMAFSAIVSLMDTYVEYSPVYPLTVT
jgi:hypothetical protein